MKTYTPDELIPLKLAVELGGTIYDPNSAILKLIDTAKSLERKNTKLQKKVEWFEQTFDEELETLQDDELLPKFIKIKRNPNICTDCGALDPHNCPYNN